MTENVVHNTGFTSETEPCLWKMKMGTELEIQPRHWRIYWLDILVAAFGVGSWVGVNGMYLQLPLLVEKAPEGWRLPNFMAVTIQIANIAPIAYSLLRKTVSQIPDKAYIHVVLILGTIAAFLMSFLYHVTITICGTETSTVFLILVFFVAAVGCTSSVLFYPFMRHYRDVYLISYLIGEGLSGFLPSIMSLIQGIGGNAECIIQNGEKIIIENEPRFGVTPFLLFVAALMLLSWLSFTYLNITDRFETEKVETEDRNKNDNEESDNSIQGESLWSVRNIILLCLMATVCAFGNGVYPSIQTYSSLSYSNTAYHLSVTLSSMANPLACFLAVFLPKTSNSALAILSSLCALVSSYILATALLSPEPPLRGFIIGEILVVVSWIAAVALVSYIKLCVATVFRGLGGHAMFMCGAISQAGSAIGSLILFFLLNYAPSLFVQGEVQCQLP